ncbi:glutamate formimidoyltransferase [Mariniplasma anaerobium]|uniref:glutamate formimidoyltransferase n=1 Tax=Mariniplasma anaerobium TaxID=2735436 RepID=A0A7U9THD1_9MOLU|nr:glutamate formimidoyltransferase [Mariniplasma anaerobium]BCR35265.1 glutamate formiminotransferase [Mariniplasma anaerobium]
MKKIVQCVPNFSEGIKKDIIEKIVEPLKNRSGFKLISYESDEDYNRTVVTLIGDPNDMIKPLIEFFEQALIHIDMNHQKGEHPRMGAVDVVPFIPIENITLDECVEVAKSLSQHISDKFGIPIFLYAKAATQENRISLPTIRKGEFEGMKEKLKDEEWKPDFGKPDVHKTFGVTAIGVRTPLIAYNIDLDTDDMEIAKKLARTIRQSSGGFQYVQAGPAFLKDRGHVQVTMNILDFKKNPIYRIYEMIQMEALRYKVKISSSEIIGLCPYNAIFSSLKYYLSLNSLNIPKKLSFDDIIIDAKKYLKLRDFDKNKIIEYHIEGIL